MEYEGYTKEGEVDYSQNCHGYAFGCGDWPDDDQYGAATLLGEPWCYDRVYDVKDAELAYHENHTIKVAGAECEEAYYSYSVIGDSDEKFRESAIYKREEGCPDNIDVAKAHKPPKVSSANELSFEFYEKVNQP